MYTDNETNITSVHVLIACSWNRHSQLVVYKATVKANDGEVKNYTGCTDRTLKKDIMDTWQTAGIVS